jgi:hypothetical protein
MLFRFAKRFLQKNSNFLAFPKRGPHLATSMLMAKKKRIGLA